MQHSVLIGTLLTRSRLTLGAGLVGALLLSATGCHKSSSSSTSGGTTQPDDDVLFPFHTPFDFKDSFYLENGVDPAGFAKRLTPDDPAATKGRSLDPTKNNTRILAILGGYDAAGALLYYPKPPAPMTPAAFTPDQKGERAKILANNFRAFLFPQAGAALLSSAAGERRHELQPGLTHVIGRAPPRERLRHLIGLLSHQPPRPLASDLPALHRRRVQHP